VAWGSSARLNGLDRSLKANGQEFSGPFRLADGNLTDQMIRALGVLGVDGNDDFKVNVRGHYRRPDFAASNRALRVGAVTSILPSLTAVQPSVK